MSTKSTEEEHHYCFGHAFFFLLLARILYIYNFRFGFSYNELWFESIKHSFWTFFFVNLDIFHGDWQRTLFGDIAGTLLKIFHGDHFHIEYL